MNYVGLAILALVALFGVKACNGWKHDAQVKAIAQIEQQVTASADDLNKDAEREMKRLLALRPVRQAAIAKTQAKRKVDDAARSKVDPVYRIWATEPVPDFVVDRLRDNATTSGGLYLNASDRESWFALQSNNPVATKADAGGRFGRLRLGPARPD